jgi:hypothetical protein
MTTARVDTLCRSPPRNRLQCGLACFFFESEVNDFMKNEARRLFAPFLFLFVVNLKTAFM